MAGSTSANQSILSARKINLERRKSNWIQDVPTNDYSMGKGSNPTNYGTNDRLRMNTSRPMTGKSQKALVNQDSTRALYSSRNYTSGAKPEESY